MLITKWRSRGQRSGGGHGARGSVESVKESKQCVNAPGVMELCVERSRNGLSLPEGWTVSSQSNRRKLQESESVVGIVIEALGKAVA